GKMKWVLVWLLLLFPMMILYGQSVTGKWVTYDIFNKSIAESVVEINEVDGRLFVRIDSIIPEEHRLDICSRCEGNLKDQPIKNLQILNGARLREGVWQDAKILNAKNGRWYGCQITPTAGDTLKVRGFIGYPFFGKNLYWTRFRED
ncbi:MAG: DUF2147 domain-containing protein, partial [Lutimonas sp.]